MQALKRAVLHRKNALFYRTLHGAEVGDLFMTLIHTCQLCGANSFDHLTELTAPPLRTGSHARGVDALELSPDVGTGRSMMNPGWLKRIDSGHAEASRKNGRKTGR